MTDERGVHPDCRNASNPYHECSEYCFQIIAEAKARMEQRGLGSLVQAGGGIGQASSGALEQNEDLHDDRQDYDDHADGDREYPVVESVDVTNLTGRKQKLWELKNIMSASLTQTKGDNKKEIAAVKKRMEAPTEKKKIGKLLDANGLDMTKAYMLDTQESAEGKYKKWEKDPAPYVWDVFNRKTLYDSYIKRTKNVEVDLEEYNRIRGVMKEVNPEFYRDASSLQYGKEHFLLSPKAPKTSEEKIDRMVKEPKE
ncbi:hypothetical protein ACJW30_07G146400 [Castanea mollissima]